MSVSQPARVQFDRFFVSGEGPTIGQPGSFALNVPDRKLWTFNAVGQPIRISQDLREHDPSLFYGIGDFVTTGDTIWRALVDVGQAAFNPAQWTRMGATSSAAATDPAASGVTTGGVLSLVGGTTVGVTAGSGNITDSAAPSSVTTTPVSWGALSGAIAGGGQAVRAITINAAGNLGSASAMDLTEIRRSRIVLGFAYYDGTGNITHIQNVPRVQGQTANDVADLIQAMGGPFKVSGGEVTAAGMTLNTAGGINFTLAGRWRNTPDTPNRVPFAGGTPVTFDAVAADGTITDAATATVPTTQWAGGVVPAGFATIQYLFATPSGNKMWLQQGQTLYASARAAEIAIRADWDGYAPRFPMQSPVVVLAAVVAAQGATDLTDPSQGNVVSTLPGPRVGLRFNLATQDTDFLPLNGSAAMTGPLDMNGNAVLNATIDEGVF